MSVDNSSIIIYQKGQASLRTKPYQVPDHVEITCPPRHVTSTRAQSLSLADTYQGYVMECVKEANAFNIHSMIIYNGNIS